MDQNNSGFGALLVGSGMALVTVLAWLIFPFFTHRPPSRPTPVGVPRVSPLATRVQLLPGSIVSTPDGNRRAQIEVSVAPDWKLTEFEVREIFHRHDGRDAFLRASSVPPQLPTRQGFLLEFDLPPLNSEADPKLLETVKIRIKYRARSGFLGSKKVNVSRGTVFRVDEKALTILRP